MKFSIIEQDRKQKTEKLAILLIWGIALFGAVVCTPISIWLSSDVIFSDTALPQVWDVVLAISQFAFYWAAFSFLIYLSAEYGLINNRKLLSGFFESLGIADATEVLRIVDKIDKAGEDYVKAELLKNGASEEATESILKLVKLFGEPLDIVNELKNWGIENEKFIAGLDELEAVCKSIKALGVPSECFKLNLKIARGLDYYTGTVYETFLNDYPELGSVCSGGRYDELAQNYTKQSLPGVGISIGLSRLFYQLNEAGIISNNGKATPTNILIVPMDDTVEYALKTASEFRSRGIATEVYLNGGKMGKKLNYANKLGIPYVAVVGESEMQNGTVMLKDMESGEQKEVKVDDVVI
jgi:histidyl-tRNA synthetase